MENTGTDGNSAPAATSSPSTFAEAFASEPSSGSEPSQQTTTPSAAEQPTSDAQAQPQQTDDPRSPFIPRSRFDEVNTKKTALESELQELAWAKQVNRPALEQAQRLGTLFQTDRAAFVRELIGDNLSPELVSEFARQLAGRRGQQAAPTDAPSMVPVQLEDGSVVQMPRDPQAWLQWHQQQWTDQVKKDLAPAMSAAEKLAFAEQQYQAQTFAQTVDKDISALPGMDPTKNKENRIAVGERVKAYCQQLSPEMADNPVVLENLTLKAWRDIVLPTLSQQAESRVLDTLQQKAAASTSVNPGSAAASSPRSVTSFHDPSLKW